MKLTPLTFVGLALTLAVSHVARAERENTPPANPTVAIKVLGRGIADRQTGQTIQVACVGKKLDSDGIERACTTVQFFAFDPRDQKSWLLGDPLEIADGMKLKRELKGYLKNLDIDKRMNPWGTVYGIVFVSGVLLFIPASTPAVVYYIWGGAAGLGLIPAIKSSFFNNLMGLKNTSDLQKRSVSAWQVHPNKISHKRFGKIFARLWDRRKPVSVEDAFKSAGDASVTDATQDAVSRIEWMDSATASSLAAE